jgi:hypothetical protein
VTNSVRRYLDALRKKAYVEIRTVGGSSRRVVHSRLAITLGDPRGIGRIVARARRVLRNVT